ncbi:MAG TPA: biotin/lipoyl-containing protein [Vicinamibacterales bacterium]|nr:biotin/lipoyl-containing protein [Vicinamibacterales bacterium]
MLARFARVAFDALMQYEVEVGGRRRQVVITREGDGFAVAVDGATKHVDVARIDGNTLSLIVDNVTPADITIAPAAAAGHMTVHVNGTPVSATLNGRRRWDRRDEGGEPDSAPQRLAAPMPGKVVRVLVGVGDTVQARQPVVVVEAMKMENEMRASRAGTVAEVHVREGMSVEAGAPLIVIQ